MLFLLNYFSFFSSFFSNYYKRKVVYLKIFYKIFERILFLFFLFVLSRLRKITKSFFKICLMVSKKEKKKIYERGEKDLEKEGWVSFLSSHS